jgi:hypothetical protein
MIISVYTISAWSRFIAGIAGSNPAEGTDNRLVCFLYVVYVEDALEKGKSWNEVKRMAGNRTISRCFVDAVCPLRDNRN